ncbi:ADP-ribosyltransferase [Vibrio cholerae]
MKFIILLMLSCFSVSTIANDYFIDLRKPVSNSREDLEIRINKHRGFAKWSKAALDFSQKSLTKEEGNVINAYTRHIYDPVNSYLRDPNEFLSKYPEGIANVKKLIADLNSGLRKLPVYKGKAFRATSIRTDLVQKLKTGDIVVDPGFFSTSFLPETAKSYFENTWSEEGRTKVLLEIKVNHSAAPLVLDHANDSEILILNSTPLKISHMGKIDGIDYLALETVDNLKGFKGSIYNFYNGEPMQVTEITKPLVEQAGGVHNVCNVI